MKRVMIATASGVKSIPLSQFPAEAWQSVFDSIGDSSSRIIKQYESVPWLYRGVNARADALASLPLTWQVNGKEDDEYEPPFELNMPQFLNEIEGDLTLYGAAYIWLDIGKPTRARQPARLHPGTIKPLYDSQVGLKGFERTVAGNKIELSLQEVGWIWLPNRKKEIGPGTPPGQAALRAAGALSSIDAYVEKFFDQGTISPVIIGVEDATEDEDLKRVETWFQRRLSGIANAFGAVALRGSIKPFILGQNELNKLSLKPLNDQKREDIATALGVPQTMLFSNAANYATANQDAFNWYELTIVPEGQRVEGPLNKFLFNPIGVTCKFKPERLELYQEREADKAAKMVPFYDRNLVTKNEVRQQAGWSPVEGGDEFADGSAPDEPYVEDLRRWRTKAVKRLKLGKSMDFAFESDLIPEDVFKWVAERILQCKTSEDLDKMFEEARKLEVAVDG